MNNAYVFSIIEHNYKLCITQNSQQQDYVIFVQLVFQAVKAEASDLEV